MNLWIIIVNPKIGKPKLNPDRGRVEVIYVGYITLAGSPGEGSCGRYSPRSHKDRFVVPLA